MSMMVREVKDWLATLNDDDAIGISEDDEMTLRLADERYDEPVWLEIGMALSNDYVRRVVAEDGQRMTWEQAWEAMIRVNPMFLGPKP